MIQTTIQQDARRALMYEAEGHSLSTELIEGLMSTKDQGEAATLLRGFFGDVAEYVLEDDKAALCALDGVSSGLVDTLLIGVMALRRFTRLDS